MWEIYGEERFMTTQAEGTQYACKLVVQQFFNLRQLRQAGT